MAEAISIGANIHLPAIREGLHKEFCFLRRQGLIIDIREESRGDLVFFGCDYKQGEKGAISDQEAGSLFRQYIANALTEVIVSHWEKSLVWEIIKQHYYYFNRKEQKKILGLACKSLNGDEVEASAEYIYSVHRKTRILYKLLDYLENNDEIVLDGFIRFRLKEYMEELRDAVDRAVDDLMLEKEYREFIRLLRYFVEVQEPKQREIHVVMLEGNRYQLMDGQGEVLTAEELEDMLVDISDGDISGEDLLISALISLAPAQVHLHLGDSLPNREVVETIKKVFAGRIDICPGCYLCNSPDSKKGEQTKPR